MSPLAIRTRLAAFGRHRCILAVVMLVELMLFVGHHRERWCKALIPRHQRQVQTGAGLVIRSDGLGYYAWLRSLLIDGDWSFDNEFDQFNPLRDYLPPPGQRTELGLRANHWSIGPACVWALTVVPGHLCIQALPHGRGAWPADGYSLPYQLMLGATTLLATGAGLAFLYGICGRYARPAQAALAIAFLVLGTTIIYYFAIEVSMAHGLATVAVAGLVWYWLRTYGSARLWRWGLVGILVGTAALMRWQLLTFAVLPAGECLLHLLRGRKLRQRLIGLVLAALGAGVALLPQLIAWRVVYGHWIATPLATGHNWWHPPLDQVLFSRDRSLFYWTPMTVLALAGGLVSLWHRRWSWRKDALAASVQLDPEATWQDQESLFLLLAAFCLQVLVIASLLGPEVGLGESFGFRFLTESLVALAPGLAYLLQRASPGRFRCLAGLGVLLVLWNVVLVHQQCHGILRGDAGADLGTLVANTIRLVHRKHLLIAGQMTVGPVLLGLLIPWTGRRHGS